MPEIEDKIQLNEPNIQNQKPNEIQTAKKKLKYIHYVRKLSTPLTLNSYFMQKF